MKRKTTKEFIEEANKIHNNKYDYGLSEYINTDTKVKIICPVHGMFEQIPKDHLKGRGCKFCGSEKSAKSKTRSIEEFIKKAREFHGDKYDYSLVDYKNRKVKIKIVCPIHGVFEQLPYVHLKPCGCPKCSNNIKLTTEEFISRANNIFPYYDYSKVNYINSSIKVEIICQNHGSWFISPNDILRGHGCPKCQESKGERIIRNWFLNNGFLENIDFECQKKFTDCIDKRPLPFDFYFKPKDLLIEYQGLQHYAVIKGREQRFTKICEHDKIKKSYAEEKHNFLEISYKEFNKIEKILNREILGV